MEMLVVEVREHGVWLLAKNVDQYLHRILVKEDANHSAKRNDELFNASVDAGEKLYRKGDFAGSQLSDLDVYLLRKVGLFPDVLERKVMHHFEKGDHSSIQRRNIFQDLDGHLYLMVGRTLEAKDAARGALKTPWWTLGRKYKEVADMAQWEDEQIKHIKEKVTERASKKIYRRESHLLGFLYQLITFIVGRLVNFRMNPSENKI